MNYMGGTIFNPLETLPSHFRASINSHQASTPKPSPRLQKAQFTPSFLPLSNRPQTPSPSAMSLLSRGLPQSGRTFQEVMEQQAARQAGFADSIPLQRFVSSRLEDDVEYHPDSHRPMGGASQSSGYAQSYHRPTRAAHPSISASVISSIHLPSTTSLDLPRKSISSSNSGSGTSYRADSTPPPASYPPSSSSAGSIPTHPLTPTSSIHYPSWSNSDWGHPDLPSSPLSREVSVIKKKEGGLKAWLKKRGDKGKGKDKAEDIKEVKMEKEKPVFVGGGRGGAQNRRPRASTASAVKPSSLGPIPETPAQSSRGSLGQSPLTNFTPDVQEALETLTPKPKAVFVGGGRGGMQNRKMKDVLPSGASGSWKSKSGSGMGAKSTSDGSSTRKSIMSMTSSMRDELVHSGAEGLQGGSKPAFVGGGRGGVQNRKPKDMAGTLKSKKSRAGLGTGDLSTGIGVSTFTVTSSK